MSTLPGCVGPSSSMPSALLRAIRLQCTATRRTGGFEPPRLCDVLRVAAHGFVRSLLCQWGVKGEVAVWAGRMEYARAMLDIFTTNHISSTYWCAQPLKPSVLDLLVREQPLPSFCTLLLLRLTLRL